MNEDAKINVKSSNDRVVVRRLEEQKVNTGGIIIPDAAKEKPQEGEALATLVVNKLRGTFTACAVKAPGFGDRRKEMLKDLAILTGGEVISEELGIKLENIKLQDLGKAKKVVVEKEKKPGPPMPPEEY